MSLDKAEYKRRFAAALALVGRTADEVDEELEAEPWLFEKEAASRAGRPSDKYGEPNRALSYALGVILGVGEAWFEAENWWDVIAGASEPGAAVDPVEAAKAEREAIEQGLLTQSPRSETSGQPTAASRRGFQK